MPRPDSRIVLASAIVGVMVLTVWRPEVGTGEPGSAAVTVHVEPQLIGSGSRPAQAREAGYVVDVDVAGATAGHDVRLDVWSEGDWVGEDEGKTDADGRVRLESSAGVFSRVVTELDGAHVQEVVDPARAGPLLYWSEEFDEDALSDEWLGVPQPDGGGTCMTSDESAATVADGLMALTVEEDPETSCKRTRQPARLNGHVILRGAISYGTTAARIRFPRSREATGKFWLQPGDPSQPWVMDDLHEGVVIAGTAGTDRDPRMDTAVHHVVDGTIRTSRRVASAADTPTDGRFHVYSVEWRPDGYTFKIDGKTIRTVEAGGPFPPMTIGLAMLAPNDQLPSDPEDRTMYVDWLRIWA